jgi:hypothetical protein
MSGLIEKVSSDWAAVCDDLSKSYSDLLERRVKGLKEIISLELSLVDSMRGVLSDEHLDILRNIFVDVRFSNNLLCSTRLYKRFRGDIYKRQALKLVISTYKYNRYLISGGTDESYLSTLRSKIKYSTNCPHCGELSSGVLKTLEEKGLI